MAPLEWLTSPVATVIGAAGTLLGQERANRQHRSSAREQMEFQRYMSNTAHQRQVADLRAAGLNPIMAAKLGGSSSPQGAKYEPKNVVGAAVQSAFQIAQASKAMADADILQNRKKLVDAQTEKELSHKLNLDIKNNMDKFTYQYFKDKGYPPSVLTARPFNIIMTELWEKLPQKEKTSLVTSLYTIFGYSVQEVEKFLKNPKRYLKDLSEGYIPDPKKMASHMYQGALNNIKWIYRKYDKHIVKPIDAAIDHMDTSARDLVRDIKQKYFHKDVP